MNAARSHWKAQRAYSAKHKDASATVLRLFRSGKDTVDIADELRLPEARVCFLLNQAREWERRTRAWG